MVILHGVPTMKAVRGVESYGKINRLLQLSETVTGQDSQGQHMCRLDFALGSALPQRSLTSSFERKSALYPRREREREKERERERERA